MLDNISVKESGSLKLAEAGNETNNPEASVSPNPAADNLIILTKASVSCGADLIVTDIAGRNLIIKKVQLSEGINNIELCVADLPQAIYFLNITKNDGSKNEVIKFVKE